MKYLRLSDGILVLDEFSANMDHEHKRATNEMIKSLTETHSFSQLIVISHDFASYGGFSNVDTCVLSPNGIIVPDSYNQHVKIVN